MKILMARGYYSRETITAWPRHASVSPTHRCTSCQLHRKERAESLGARVQPIVSAVPPPNTEPNSQQIRSQSNALSAQRICYEPGNLFGSGRFEMRVVVAKELAERTGR